MNGWTFAALSQARTMPWKNGGGVTHELLAGPDPQDWRWRLSVADVAQRGPFSAFPGVRRWFAVLSGRGVVLDVEGSRHRLTADSAPFAFHGAAAVNCELIDGATRDFNLMVRADTGRMERVSGEYAGRAMPGLAAVYAVATAIVVVNGRSTQIPAATLAWRLMDADVPVQVTSESALWMEAGI